MMRLLTLSFVFLAGMFNNSFLAAQSLSLQDDFNNAYFYKISNKQADSIYFHLEESPDTGILTQPVLEQPVDVESAALPVGNYIKVWFSLTKMHYEYVPVMPWSVYLLDDNKDLVFQLIDRSSNKPVSIQAVTCNGKKVLFDTETQSYRFEGKVDTGTFILNDGGNVFYASFRRSGYYHYHRTFVQKRDAFLRHRPFYDLGLAYRIGTRSLADLYVMAQGERVYNTIYGETWREITGLWRRYQRHGYDNVAAFYFSKPTYRPHDTVKFKVYLANQTRRKWYNKPVLFFLEKDRDEDLYLGKVTPKRLASGYNGQFVLQDSMDLDLDKTYKIKALFTDSSQVGEGSFTYEDYELKKAVFSIELPDEKKQYSGKPFHLTFTAKDDNGLPMPDTKAALTITYNDITDPAPDRLFIPDTLWTYSTTVSSGSSTIIIPDSIFPDAQVDYNIEAVLQNSEHERTELDEDVTFYPKLDDIAIRLENDSIKVTCRRVLNKPIHIYGQDRFEHVLVDTITALPCSLPVNTHVASYFATPEMDYEYDEDENVKLELRNEDAGIRMLRKVKGDTLSLSLINKRHLPLVYHLYKMGKEYRRGTGSDFPVNIKLTDKDDYYWRADYVWGGEVVSYYSRPEGMIPGKLNLVVDQPSVIYPGKEVTIRIKATDEKEKPIPGMNLLAYGVTEKFENRSFPRLPQLNRYRYKESRLSFNLDDRIDDRTTDLDYGFWKHKLQMDTSWTYRFLYPVADSIAVTCVSAADSLTQVAPFVVKKGAIEPAYYVLIDQVPVYFSFTDVRVPYTFITDTFYHQITIRTRDKIVTVFKFKAQPGRKNVFSVDADRLPENVYQIAMPDTLTAEEKNSLGNYVMQINMSSEALDNAYLLPADDTAHVYAFTLPSDRNDNSANKTVGPVCWRYWTFGSYARYGRTFEYEPGYVYQFADGLVKMQCAAFNNVVPSRPRYIVPSLNDALLNVDTVAFRYLQQMQNKRRTQPIREKMPISGNAGITFEWDAQPGYFLPVNVLLVRKNDSNDVNIYPGNTREISLIDTGIYRLLFVDEHNSLFQSDTFYVQDNGYNFFRVKEIHTVPGSYAQSLNARLNQLYQPVRDTAARKPVQPLNSYISGLRAKQTYMINGAVIEKAGGGNEPVIGAGIKLIGTAYRTQTDIDGHFEIPWQGNKDIKLEISYYGFETRIVNAFPGMIVEMAPSDNALTELTITTPYGPPVTKGRYTGAADVITARRLEKTPVSDLIKAIEGAAPGVQVTNTSGTTALKPLIVVDGVIYNGDIAELDTAFIVSTSILKDALSASIYGSRAANGIIVVITKPNAVLPEKLRLALQQEKATSPEQLMKSALRSNFRDDAYWEPDLVTDKEGRASFNVTFPDDITSWETVVVAANAKKLTGQAIGSIKSFKPVSASLHTPRFLVAGDSSRLIGKAVNYQADTVTASTSFYRNDTLVNHHELRLGAFANDTLLLTAAPHEDSVKLKYLVSKPDGYFDGEEQWLSIKPLGTLIAEGGFSNLFQADTGFVIYPQRKQDTLHLYATAAVSDILLQEADIVRNYGYLCNEQMASKVLALLSRQRIQQARGQKMNENDREYIQSLLDKLAKRRNAELQWGWWENGPSVMWISNHVARAITAAKAKGYRCNIDLASLMDRYIFELERDTTLAGLDKLQILSDYGARVNYEKYISRMEHYPDLSLNNYLELLLLRQQQHLPYNTKRMKATMETDIYGNIYWKDTARNVYSNELLTTLNALKVLRQDTTLNIDRDRVISWILQQRSGTGWRNTYESANVIETLAGLVPLSDSAAMRPRLRLSGPVDEVVDTFPYRNNVTAGSALSIHKQGKTPVYFTWYYNKWDTSDAQPADYFNVHSAFKMANKEVDFLKAGEPVTVQVNVQVKKSAEFVMVEVPIPAGCSYQSKTQPYYSRSEVHREYFEDKVCIFCEKLPKGNYIYNIELLPRYEGSYTVNPAKATLMYFPVLYGKEKIRKVSVQQ